MIVIILVLYDKLSIIMMIACYIYIFWYEQLKYYH